jgi:uroporphyrinogen decarboxylase
MNQRENFIEMMEGRTYEHVPFDLPMTGPVEDELERQLGTRDAGKAFNLDFHYVGAGWYDDSQMWRSAYESSAVPIPEGAWVGGSGQVERPGDSASLGAAYHLTEMFHPLSYLGSLEEIQGLPWHDLDDPAIYKPIASNVAAAKEAGKVATIGLECSIFESAWYLRGMEELYCDIADENGIADWLLDRFMGQTMRLAVAATLGGIDFIRFGDDVGTQRGMMMSLPFWRKHLKPRLASLVSAVKTLPNPPYIQYHSDGDISDIVDDLIEVGIDVLNPVQPECMSLDVVAGRWKDRIAFSGMIGTQTTMPFGSVEDVQKAVTVCEKWIRRGAKMIVAPTHVLEPDVPWANIVALSDAVRRITL